MEVGLFWQALVLGIVEGLTEFLPVSSTGHLILMDELLGFQGPSGKVFEIVIQLGAILAVCVLYFRRLWELLVTLPSSAASRRFALTIVIAFLPAAVIGVLFHRIITEYLFSPYVVSVTLILGGLAILVIERLRPVEQVHEMEAITPWLGFKIGCCQVISMIPGVSRSGATILGAILMGVDRRTATEFSFFLAIPTMFGATVYQLFKNKDALGDGGKMLIAVGFIAAFLSALLVVRTLVGFVSRHGFAPFAWYRLAIGTIMLIFLLIR